MPPGSDAPGGAAPIDDEEWTRVHAPIDSKRSYDLFVSEMRKAFLERQAAGQKERTEPDAQQQDI
jgi:hypothetical protein